jgi:hypothetical protein
LTSNDVPEGGGNISKPVFLSQKIKNLYRAEKSLTGAEPKKKALDLTVSRKKSLCMSRAEKSLSDAEPKNIGYKLSRKKSLGLKRAEKVWQTLSRKKGDLLKSSRKKFD